MSETSYERGYRHGETSAGNSSNGTSGDSPDRGARPPSKKGGNSGSTILTRQMGPLPLWAWMVLGLVGILGISYFKARKGSSSAGSNTVPTGSIPQFVNQVYTNPTPPGDDDDKNTWKPSPTPPITTPTPPGGGGSKPPKPPPKVIHVAAFKYTVQRGDTLLSLSQKFLGTTNRTALAHGNGLGTGAGLRAGQIITIPAHLSPPGAKAPAGGAGSSGSGGSTAGGGTGEGED